MSQIKMRLLPQLHHDSSLDLLQERIIKIRRETFLQQAYMSQNTTYTLFTFYYACANLREANRNHKFVAASFACRNMNKEVKNWIRSSTSRNIPRFWVLFHNISSKTKQQFYFSADQ